MKLALHDQRAVLVIGDEVADIATLSDGRFGPDPMQVYEQWDDFRGWAAGVTATTGALDHGKLGCPVPRPRQVFAIGLNYHGHAAESGAQVPAVPATFTKFPTALAGPYDDIEIVGDRVDWEVELVAIIGRRADRVSVENGWNHIAGLTIGQDISDRYLQFAAGAQFSLGKSRRGYGPMGPWVVSLDEFADPGNLALGCSVDGETKQDARTDDMVFGVPQLVAELSSVLPLLPGDIIFTGTPAGVGQVRQPPQFLRPGSVLETWIEGIGRTRHRCVG